MDLCDVGTVRGPAAAMATAASWRASRPIEVSTATLVTAYTSINTLAAFLCYFNVIDSFSIVHFLKRDHCIEKKCFNSKMFTYFAQH